MVSTRKVVEGSDLEVIQFRLEFGVCSRLSNERKTQDLEDRQHPLRTKDQNIELRPNRMGNKKDHPEADKAKVRR